MSGDHALGDQARAVTHVGPLAGAQPTDGGRVAAFGSGQEDEIPLKFGSVGEEDGRLRHDRTRSARQNRLASAGLEPFRKMRGALGLAPP